MYCTCQKIYHSPFLIHELVAYISWYFEYNDREERSGRKKLDPLRDLNKEK